VRPRRSSLAAAALLSFAVGACGSDGEVSNPDVRPFEEVQASDLVFEPDPTNPTRAVFHVTTTEPMICAIVWGETQELGRFNNSLDMAGTGIVEHDVFLPDVESGKEYFYVVQGTTADGTLHRSDVGTFSVDLPTGATVDRGPDLAEGARVVDVSSAFSDAFAAANAVDGDLSTEWSSAGDGDDAHIEIDLGEVVEVEGVEFLTRSMTDGSSVTETFTVTVDGGETLGPFPAGTPADPAVADVDVEGRVFRFEVDTSTGGNTGAVEILLYGP
jgi:hypothetical protein